MQGLCTQKRYCIRNHPCIDAQSFVFLDALMLGEGNSTSNEKTIIYRYEMGYVQSSNEQLQRWRSFFSNNYTNMRFCRIPVGPLLIEEPQNQVLDAGFNEIETALNLLKNGKMAGMNGIRAKIFKVGRDNVIQ